MVKVVSNVFVQIVMLVAFVGQVMAYNTVTPCESSLGAPASLIHTNIYNNIYTGNFNDHNTNNDNNTGHESANQDDSASIKSSSSPDCCDDDCCDAYCICIANAYSSFAYFNADIISAKIAVLAEAPYKELSAQPNATANTLYRPPIIAS